jgi:HEAT repeat protein
LSPRIDVAIPNLIEALRDKDEKVSQLAFDALLPMSTKLRPAILKAIKHNDPWLRSKAVLLLVHCPDQTKALIPSLVAAFDDTNASVRENVIYALGVNPPRFKEATPTLLLALKDKEKRVRQAALKVLGDFGQAANAAVPFLIKALKNNDAELRYWGCFALGKIGPKDQRVVLFLIETLKNKKEFPKVRGIAATTLAAYGSRAKAAVPVLVDTLKSSDLNHYEEAFFILNGSVESLGEIGPESKVAVPTLIAILKTNGANYSFPDKKHKQDRTPFLRPLLLQSIIKTLGQIGPGARKALPILTKMLKHEDDEIQTEALEAIKKIKTSMDSH